MFNVLQKWFYIGKKKCEFIIENYNGYLQALAIIAILYVSYFGAYLQKTDREQLIVEILSIMLYEILILSIKDSITQNKLNKLLVITNSINQLVPTSAKAGQNFEELIMSTTHDLYISGIACNNVWLYMSRIIELLDRGCHIKLLISNEEMISQNAKFYFGLEDDKDNTFEIAVSDVKNKIDVTLNYFKLNEKIKHYYCLNKFEIRRSSQPFTLAFIGIDLETNRTDKVLKITHYTYGCKDTLGCPSYILTLPEHEHWFNYYLELIKGQWEKAELYKLTECKIK